METRISLLKDLVPGLPMRELKILIGLCLQEEQRQLRQQRLHDNLLPLSYRVADAVQAERLKPEAERSKELRLPICEGEPVRIELGDLEQVGGYRQALAAFAQRHGCKFSYKRVDGVAPVTREDYRTAYLVIHLDQPVEAVA